MEEPKLKLFSYWRSSCSCSCRVRIALKLKGLKYEYKTVNLLERENFSAEFSKLNPLNYVPVLVDEDIVVADSFAIVMYLEEKYPQHPLLPSDLQKKAINYRAANIVSSNIQPFQNLLVMADLFLAPQIHAAIKWFNLNMAQFPLLLRLNDAYNELPAFQDAMPAKQPDYVKSKIYSRKPTRLVGFKDVAKRLINLGLLSTPVQDAVKSTMESLKAKGFLELGKKNPGSFNS